MRPGSSCSMHPWVSLTPNTASSSYAPCHPPMRPWHPPSWRQARPLLSDMRRSLPASYLKKRVGPASGSSLNAAARAPVKGSGKGKKRDHSQLTCHYCNKKGHIKPDCRKRKKDEEEAAKKAGSSGAKAANLHVKVPTLPVPSTASIQEVHEDEDNEIGVALYAAERERWMMDSGATHHISPHKSDFKDYPPCKGTVRLGEKSTIDQVGVGSVVFKTSLGTPITLSNVLHIPGVKTWFMSTRALAQKGAEISFAK